MVLEHLLRNLGDARVLVLVNHRSQFEPSWGHGVQRLELQPLGIEDTRAILRRILGEMPDPLVRRIHQRTGGNPLFVEELCRSVLELGAENGLSAKTVLGDLVPDSVSAVVRARIDRLTPAHVELLKLAAVVGEEFSTELLEKLVGSPKHVAERLEGLSHAALIERAPDGRSWRFRHAIVQDVAYAMLLLTRRRTLHAAVGRALEEQAGLRVEGQIERLAHHFARSDDRAKALLYLERSGDKAVASGAMVQALGHYREAIEILDEEPATPELMRKRIDLSLKLANTAIFRPWRSVNDVLELSYRFAVRLGDARAERRGLYWMGWLESSVGSWPAAIATFERCLPLAQAAGDVKLEAQIHSNLGQAMFHTGDYERAVWHLERSIERRREVGSDFSAGTLVGYSQGYLALIDSEAGRFDVADARLEEAFKLVGLAGQLQFEGAIQTIRLTLELFRGDWPACLAAAKALSPIAQRIGSTYMQAMSRGLGGFARFVTGELEAGIAEMRAGVALLEKAENGMNLSLLYACLASALVSVGAIDEAEAVAQRALARAEAGDRMGEPSARRVLLMLAAQRQPQGGPEVEAAFEAAIEAPRRRGSPREEAVSWLTAAVFLGASRDLAWRRKVIADCLERFVAMQMPWYADHARMYLSLLPEDESA
jgi:tetratricopeptide (TPR) repeat protein